MRAANRQVLRRKAFYIVDAGGGSNDNLKRFFGMLSDYCYWLIKQIHTEIELDLYQHASIEIEKDFFDDCLRIPHVIHPLQAAQLPLQWQQCNPVLGVELLTMHIPTLCEWSSACQR